MNHPFYLVYSLVYFMISFEPYNLLLFLSVSTLLFPVFFSHLVFFAPAINPSNHQLDEASVF